MQRKLHPALRLDMWLFQGFFVVGKVSPWAFVGIKPHGPPAVKCALRRAIGSWAIQTIVNDDSWWEPTTVLFGGVITYDIL